jgi:hypothetical protein
VRRVFSILFEALGRPVGRSARHGCWTAEPEWARRRKGMGTEEERRLPKFDCYLDESDPEITILRRQDGAFVAAFSTQRATRESILEAAVEDYKKSLEANAQSLGLRGDGHRKRSA